MGILFAYAVSFGEFVGIQFTPVYYFKAERVIARRKNKGKVEYLVRWQGLSPEDDTWKLYTDLPMAKSLIKQFLANFRRTSSDSETSSKAGGMKRKMGTTPKESRSHTSSMRNGPTPTTGHSKAVFKPIKQKNEPSAKNRRVPQKPKVVPTKVTDLAKKVVQRSTRTLQKVSNMNNLRVCNASQHGQGRNATIVGLRQRPESPWSQAARAAKAKLKVEPKGRTTPGKQVTRQRLPSQKQRKKSPVSTKKTSPLQATGNKSSRTKVSSKSAMASKRSSLQNVVAKKVLSVAHRASKSLSPVQSSKTNAKVVSNPRKRKLLETLHSDSSSDDDVLYSLADDVSPPKAKQAKLDSSAELHRLLISPNSKNLLTRKVLKVQVEACRSSRGSSARATPDSDPEISFKQLHSPRKLLLKDSVKSKVKYIKPEPRSQSPLPTVGSAAVAHTPGTAGSTSEPNQAHTVDSMVDLPNIPVMPLLPNSPAAASYKSLVKHISSNLQPSRGLKKKSTSSSNGEEAEPVVERRTSVRQSESAFKYKDIVVRKFTGYTQIWLFSQTKLKNAFNPKVFQELVQALHNAKFDDSRLVMLSGSGSIFSSGLDLHYLLSASDDRKTAAKNMAEGMREFASNLVSFPKPIVAAVNGPAIGFGAAILPLCDIVYASDKASFYCPYARLCQTPEGCSSFTFPQVMGMAMANEMLLAGRKLTAIEAYEIGLVSQVFWPTSMMQEVVPRVQNMAAFSTKSLEASKVLVRSHQRAKLQYTIDTECQLLGERWASSECQRAMQAYLEDEQDLLA